ncbi:coproporphyrinogen III oxidase [Streptomyces sp. AS58]|uniref:STM4012 family radical SAM protein n=1 Tax=Streptomyces sp. AS58 TaxID=1519489 RepID=UPI0006C2757D|nr:STM4012 family radical SAM protein [Streptomyces sp. AS58]KOV51057.1 coproporphyrinogen III oxidase [Streptomyces sp. AS58]
MTTPTTATTATTPTATATTATPTATPRSVSDPAPRPYESYVYAYPHKTAYRRLPDRPALRDLWSGEATDALSLYLHIPFCEVRCGFCNLFTRIGAPEGLTGAYLDAMERQARAVRGALGGPVRFAAAAFGGGTPTFLTAAELSRLCDIAEDAAGADLRAVPLSVEASPSTATADRLAVLAERGTTRLSLGVQSFVDAEARSAVRPQRRADVEAALARIRDAGIPVLNVDLIYGIDGQTETTWRHSLEAALAWRPEELYLYPLYVRPLTGLGRRTADLPDPLSDRAWDEQRLRLYRYGRDLLLDAGYEQVSMRMFRRPGIPSSSAEDYACQTDGMVGLGCGARSYTSQVHYSFDYAVDMREIRTIVDDYVARPETDFAHAEYGRWMDADEARRRHLVQSLLQAEGMETAAYEARFGTGPWDDFATELTAFRAAGWLAEDGAAAGRLRLSPEGLAHSDAVGPALFSPAVRAAMTAYERK